MDLAPETSLLPLWPGFAYKPHQITGVSWLLQRENAENAGGLLCDEMGLGKTIEILGLVKNSKLRETLLLCPKAVLPQWAEAAHRSALNVSVPKKDGVGWEIPSPFRASSPTLFLANYEKVLHNPVLGSRKWNRVVLDEAHRAVNSSGQIWKAVNEMKRKATWLVTATPIVNELKDIKNLFALVGYDRQKLNNYAVLQQAVMEACLHRSMEEMREVLPELPDRPIITKEVLDFDTEDEADFYRGIQGHILRRWRALEHDKAGANEMFRLIMRLRQLSLHPQVYIGARKRESLGYNRPDWEDSSTKFSALRRKIETSGRPSRWIVFCQFHDEMDLLQEYLLESPRIRNVVLYHGGMSDAAKAESLEETRAELDDEQHDILLLQLHSGGVGLNLQHFSKVIFMSPWWTAALMDQAVGRAVRIGQKEVVEVTLLVLKEEETMNIDQKMLEKADTKRGMLEKLFTVASRGTAEPSALFGEDNEVMYVDPPSPLAPAVTAGGGGEDPN